MFTAQHYRKLSEALYPYNRDHLDSTATVAVARMLADDNPRFNALAFLAAAGIPVEDAPRDCRDLPRRSGGAQCLASISQRPSIRPVWSA